MSNETITLDSQYPMITNLYWNMTSYSPDYAKIPEVSGVTAIDEDLEELYNAIKKVVEDSGAFETIKRAMDFSLSNAITGAALYGELRGFILGFLYCSKLETELQKKQ